ncbi:MAG TPA: DUF2197 domain-containing protein [Syntrophomonadaceae bacterium]|nr:DUF2197 domain-containing protein [Syntrophomonadaceae bacterium]HNX28526.1 DUF2197 domain-containing protein [Syntrophomonadaceae bacterium]HPR93040.1 DUF2197 domain-containing protein [Syntrophomonadaceae bacterium]
MGNIVAKCLLCAKVYNVDEEHKDYKKLVEKNEEIPGFICDYCSNKVRHESDEANKPKKPM